MVHLFQGTRRHKSSIYGISARIGMIALAIALWELADRKGWYSSSLVPSPSALWASLRDMASQQEALLDLTASLRRVIIGFLAASSLAVVLAFLFNRVHWAQPYVEFWIELIRSVPPIAWIPLAILVFGLGDRPALFIVILAGFFPAFTGATAGLAAVSPRHIEIARALRAPRMLVWRRVVVPTLLAYLLPGLRTAAGISWMAIVTAEMIGSQSGLGYRLNLCRMTLDYGSILVLMAVIGLIGFIFNLLISAAGRRLMPWQQTPGDSC